MISSFLTFAQAAAPANSSGGLLGNPIVMPVLVMVMFYFLLIRPQQTQRKELAARIASLAAGAKVITTSGIHALVHKVNDKTVTLKIADSTMVEFDKSAIAIVIKSENA